MSKRSDRHEAERLARRAAYLELRAQQTPSTPAPASEQTTVSAARLTANRANAQFSTGPTSSEGKAVSARNNTQHGLSGSTSLNDFRVVATESQAEFDASLAQFQKEWNPQTSTEHDLVNRMVVHRWLRLRAQRLQENLFDQETGDITDTRKFELYRRYESQHERGFNKCFADVLRLRAFRTREQNGFESQRRKNEAHDFKMQKLRRQEEEQIAKLAAKSQRLETPHAKLAAKSQPQGSL